MGSHIVVCILFRETSMLVSPYSRTIPNRSRDTRQELKEGIPRLNKLGPLRYEGEVYWRV